MNSKSTSSVAVKISEAMANKLKKKVEKKETEKKVDLSKIAKEVSLRREKILSSEKEEKISA